MEKNFANYGAENGVAQKFEPLVGTKAVLWAPDAVGPGPTGSGLLTETHIPLELRTVSSKGKTASLECVRPRYSSVMSVLLPRAPRGEFAYNLVVAGAFVNSSPVDTGSFTAAGGARRNLPSPALVTVI